MTVDALPRAVVPGYPDSAALRTVFGCVPSGVVAVCALTADGPAGFVVSTFTPVSLAPPLASVCVQRGSATWPRLRAAPRLGISVLAEEHGAIGRQLAAPGDRFAGLDLRATEGGGLLIAGAAAWLECAPRTEVPAGDHVIALLAIEAVHGAAGTAPLVFHASGFRRLAA
jgi:flavin reductase (DIM6/NTAB) family NADH-FMN oxidoreductase RutF